MKYAPEKYLDSGFYADGDVSAHTEKVVTCRTPHVCASCRTQIKPGEKALRESGFLEGKPVSAHTCIPCIEKWLEESGQIF